MRGKTHTKTNLNVTPQAALVVAPVLGLVQLHAGGVEGGEHFFAVSWESDSAGPWELRVADDVCELEAMPSLREKKLTPSMTSSSPFANHQLIDVPE